MQTNTEGKLYAENYSEALYAINRQDIITLDLNERSYRLALAMNYIANNGKLNDLFDEATEKYCFVIDVCSYPEADAALRAPEVLKEKGFKVGFSYNKGNTNEQKYIKFSSNGMCEPAKTESNRYNFGDFVFNCIFGDISETQLIISSAGLRPIKLKTTLQQNYEAFKKSGDDVEYSASMDTDLDRLADYEEIMFSDINDNMLIDDSVPDNVRLFTFKETQNRIGKKPGYVISGTKHFYALNGLKRYKQETGEEGDCPKSLEDVLILPIRSDPTSKDGDNDKVVDGVDLKPLSYIPNFENTNLA